MRYISDDGKLIGSEEEVVNYEKKKAESDKNRKQLEDVWKTIEALADELNNRIRYYLEKTDNECVSVSCVSDGKISVKRSKEGESDITSLFEQLINI